MKALILFAAVILAAVLATPADAGTQTDGTRHNGDGWCCLPR